MKNKTQSESSPQRGERECGPKISFMFILLSALISILFIVNLDFLAFNYEKIQQYQFWTIVTSFFYSHNQKFLVSNLISLLLLTLLREKRKGSLPFVIDLFIKNLEIFSLSIVLYLMIFWGGKVFGPFLTDFAIFQNSFSLGGITFILISELIVVLLEKKTTNSPNEEKKSFFEKSSFLCWILLFVLGILHFWIISFYAAIIIGLLESQGIFSFYKQIQNSKLNYKFEMNFQNYPHLFYFYYPIKQNSSVLFDNVQDNKLMRTVDTIKSKDIPQHNVDVENKNIYIEDKIEDEEEESEGNKSRYEEINVDDFILQKDSKETEKFKKNETFEI